MRTSRFTLDQIVKILGEAGLPGTSQATVARKYGIAEATLYRWRQKYAAMGSSEAKRLKVLEDENLRLKKLLAEKELEIQVLTEVVKKKL